MRHLASRIGRAAGVAVLLCLSATAANAHHGPAHSTPSPHPAAPVPFAPTQAPYGPYVNHVHLAPPFHWGWFGAQHFYPRVQWGRDYNGELMRWSKQRRY